MFGILMCIIHLVLGISCGYISYKEKRNKGDRYKLIVMSILCFVGMIYWLNKLLEL